MKMPETILAELRAEAKILGDHRAQVSVDRVVQFANELETALADHLTWLDEADAMKRGGFSTATWLVKHYVGWEAQGYARKDPRNPRRRQYRAIVVPLAASIDDVRSSARRAAQDAIRGRFEGQRA